MPQFLVLAEDGTDSNAPGRRIAARPFHLATAQKLKADGHFIIGGATLNNKSEMTGSMMVVEFEDETSLHQWLDNDPYVTQGVWQKIDVMPFKVANIGNI